ncbi:hypothetical protein K0B90_05820 [bacterium]|nr:hypothetical protein [bacterium]
MTKKSIKSKFVPDNIGLRIEDFKQFAEEFRDETDRSAVILGTIKLDNLLCQLLKKFMLPINNDKDDLLDDYKPLSDFGARIMACYRLGLIDAEMAKMLNVIRKLRNKFAHNLTDNSLSINSHKNSIAELVRSFKSVILYNKLLEKYFNKSHTHSAMFKSGVAMMSIRLMQGLDRSSSGLRA